MAVVTTKSQAITNLDASPRVINDSAHAKAGVKAFVAAVSVANGDSAASKFLFGQIPSNAVVHDLLVNTSADMGITTTMDLGLYRTTADGGAVVDADFFKAALSLKDGALTDSQNANGNVITLANSHKKVWELLGLSSDPAIMYDVVGTLVGACDGAGVVQVKCQYGE